MQEENYMRRCLELALLGRGSVAPNPMVGALLIYQEVIIGEGYHEHFGQPHAEVNCLNSVKPVDRGLIEKSTLYVSLEPCAHYGKTPPCADLLVENKIKKVVIGCLDSNDKVGGKGVQRMQEAGLEVQVGILEEECRLLNKRFFTFHEKKRPYIILKWAQTLDGFIGTGTDERLFISNLYTNRLVHKWRTEEAGILVGTQTALQDDPLLTSRKWPGHNPKRIIIDNKLKIPSTHQVYNDEAYTIVFNGIKNAERNNRLFVKIYASDYISEMVDSCFQMNIQSILVEGGAQTLQSFIDKGLWDEARIIVNEELRVGKGIKAPHLEGAVLCKSESLFNDKISYYTKEM